MPPRHPYESAPDFARWSRCVASVPFREVDPVVNFPFRILPTDKLATAGSCFAQHIARHIQGRGFNYFIVEDGHPIGSESIRKAYNYGVFSARYGNIYTARQLLQLIERAYDGRESAEEFWPASSGGYLDPLRPNIQPRPFATMEELLIDRAQHLAAVRRMLEELDYFVFTLGLTESWVSATDGTVYPVCPGVAGGVFDPAEHIFRNFNIDEVRQDLDRVIGRIREINRNSRIILTVSPVPLVATGEQCHVLVSTTYSKSVLRVACTDVVGRNKDVVAYFPSYEIITGHYNRGQYFGSDLRSVTEDGVAHVMELFMRHASTDPASGPTQAEKPSDDQFVAQVLEGAKLVCEEELIELSQNRKNDASLQNELSGGEARLVRQGTDHEKNNFN
jgi:hypothetical protein